MCTVCQDDVEQGEDAVTLPLRPPVPPTLHHAGRRPRPPVPSLQGARFACGHSSLIMPMHAMHGTVYTHSPKNLALISKQILFVCSSSSQTARVHFMPADHAQRTGFYRVVLPSLMRTLWLQAHNLSDDQIDLPFLFL
jgi:hypothetical protein